MTIFQQFAARVRSVMHQVQGQRNGDSLQRTGLTGTVPPGATYIDIKLSGGGGGGYNAAGQGGIAGQ